MNEHAALLAVYKMGVKDEIEEIKAAGSSPTGRDLPADIEADELLRMRWEAATRDSIMLYNGTDVYEKHVDDLALSDAGEISAFLELAAGACFRSSDQHGFAASVLEDLQGLEGSDA